MTLRSIDLFADTYDATIVVSAQPRPQQFDCKELRSHTTFSLSRTGPAGLYQRRTAEDLQSGGGTRSPDIAAPGTNIVSAAYNWDSSFQNDFVAMSGTKARRRPILPAPERLPVRPVSGMHARSKPYCSIAPTIRAGGPSRVGLCKP